MRFVKVINIGDGNNPRVFTGAVFGFVGIGLVPI
jgi:hypothetical protein